jgi:hypothetical protein
MKPPPAVPAPRKLCTPQNALKKIKNAIQKSPQDPPSPLHVCNTIAAMFHPDWNIGTERIPNDIVLYCNNTNKKINKQDAAAISSDFFEDQDFLVSQIQDQIMLKWPRFIVIRGPYEVDDGNDWHICVFHKKPTPTPPPPPPLASL